ISSAPIRRLFGGVGTSKLDTIHLNHNGIETNGDRCISDFLAANPPLRILSLIGNELNDDDALRIGLALQSNTNLRFLDLNNNKLTKRGKLFMYHQSILGLSTSYLSTLKSTVEANLNTVSGANHTCKIDGICEALMNYRDKSAKWNRSRKLCWLLGHRYLEGCNITQLESEFSEDSIGLVPHVLACINTYATDYDSVNARSEFMPERQCLSVLFEMVRDWKTPELYQFYQT
ncbi:hypothetical protein THAOC_16494, partial [Thalassiosira oceanica]